MNKIPPKTLKWALNILGENVNLHSQKTLIGATSSNIHLITVQQKDLYKKVVLRRFTSKEWLANEEDLARHEARALELASKIGNPVPALIAYDEFAQETDVPAVLMSFVEGEVVLSPSNQENWLYGFAKALVPIHQVSADELHWDYFPFFNPKELIIPTWSKNPELWKKAIAILQQSWPAYQPVFIHRDYHPTNVLWKGKEVSGIVDWVNACLGPAGIDLGHCRINLVHLYGVEAADKFLQYYQSLATADVYHPYWDLMCISNFLGDATLEMYQGWIDFGFPYLSGEILADRVDNYLVSVMDRF